MLSFEWYTESLPLNIFGIPRASSFLLLRFRTFTLLLKIKITEWKVKAVCV